MSDLFAPLSKPDPAADPRVHVCARLGCGKAGAVCGQAGQWFCWGCQPSDWGAPERRRA